MIWISVVLFLSEQPGSRPGLSWADGIFTLKQTVEQRRECNLESGLLFVSTEEAFDRITLNNILEIICECGYIRYVIGSIRAVYIGV
jgi:hypothetical protein